MDLNMRRFIFLILYIKHNIRFKPYIPLYGKIPKETDHLHIWKMDVS